MIQSEKQCRPRRLRIPPPRLTPRPCASSAVTPGNPNKNIPATSSKTSPDPMVKLYAPHSSIKPAAYVAKLDTPRPTARNTALVETSPVVKNATSNVSLVVKNAVTFPTTVFTKTPKDANVKFTSVMMPTIVHKNVVRNRGFKPQ